MYLRAVPPQPSRTLVAALAALTAIGAAACGGGDSHEATPLVQSGVIQYAPSSNVPAQPSVQFMFQPDGAPKQNTSGSFSGTRSVEWNDAIEYAYCDVSGKTCPNWNEGGRRPRCLHTGARIQVATIDAKPVAGGGGPQFLVWLKCLGG
jgi:hypothetical protein